MEITPPTQTFSSQEAGVRLDQYLAAQRPDLSRVRLQALIRSGHITVDGNTVRPAHRLKRGETIAITEPPPVPSEVMPEAIPLDILHEDADLIVLNKPAGLVVHPAAGHRGGTLVNALLHHCEALSGIGGVERPGIVHRLDKDTSGCLVVALNDAAHHSLVRQFAGRTVEKIYLALVAGKVRSQGGEIDAAIARHPVHRQKMAVVERGRPARTGWRMLREIEGGALIECRLHTGRTHQIRVHLKHIGLPLLGDEVYGKAAGYPRQMLHAWRLAFDHPRTGARIKFESPIPADFVKAGVPSILP
jgi:23S rRNA pseudouridine1911/1915/1917 synthase